MYDEVDKQFISDESEDEQDNCDKKSAEIIETEDEINIQRYELHENSVTQRYADIITKYEILQNLEENFIDDFNQEDQQYLDKDGYIDEPFVSC